MTEPQSPLQPELSVGTPLSQRLKEKYGSALEPTLSLELEPEPDAPPSSALFEKLRGQAPRGMRYKLLGEVARGGMGAILKIWDDELRRTLAMKVVIGGETPVGGETPLVDPKLLERFLEEAQVTGQLDHPGIVPVHELGLGHEGRVYFTMRLVKGEDLSKIYARVRAGKEGWTQLRALGVILKVCEAMSYAHSKHVLHRDLKPANVMVGKFGEVYVMDWGLARVLGREDKHDLRIKEQPPTNFTAVKTDRRETHEGDLDSPLVTMDGDIVGTPSFMPPEQAQGQQEKLGPHSDVYSVGAMLYALVAGQMPYVPREARVTARTILISVLNGPPKPLFELAPQTPAELIAIVEKAMAREIGERYATMQALAEDLRAYIEGRVVHAYETGGWAEAKKWVKRNKPLAASLAAAVLAVVIGGGAFAVKAKEATDARDDVARKNTELESTNSALEKAKSEALANAERAVLGEAAARENEKAAQLAREQAAEQARVATQKTNDVLSLSAQKNLDDLVARAEKLWPAHPEMIPEYEAWMNEARELIDGRPADPAKGLKKRPSLEEHKAKLAELRTKATAWTAEQVKAERESHPRYAGLLEKQSELTWRSRMLSLELWPSASQVEAQLASETLPSDANGLNTLAWALVGPDQPVYGQEVRALLLARRAVAAASEAERANFLDTLAWALFRLGCFDEALAAEDTAVAEPGGEALKNLAAKLDKAVSSWRGDELSKRREQREALAVEVADLERTVSERRSFDYEDPEARWWDVQLSKLVSDLESLHDPKSGLMGDTLADPFGWGVTKRYEFARTIRERSVDGAEGKARWDAAIAAIAFSPKYGGLKQTPQLGLLPIGADPESGLWEFAHVQSGEVAERGADGKLVLTEGTGLVFVLIPGGTFWMGAQNKDESGRNYDPQAFRDESPVHEVLLSPYFLSKYEMTQGQWERFTGRNPSNYGPSTKFTVYQHDLTHPVEQVTWTQCMEVMSRLGLELPSEAQWECGARGRTDTPWWTGTERESLRGQVNLADQTAARGGATWIEIKDWPDLEDGWVFHAPVGSLPANPCGLHEVHGNVWEWCRDGYANYSAGKQVDPVTPRSGSATPVDRGGSFRDAASRARSAPRRHYPPEHQDNNLGLRPARAFTP